MVHYVIAVPDHKTMRCPCNNCKTNWAMCYNWHAIWTSTPNYKDGKANNKGFLISSFFKIYSSKSSSGFPIHLLFEKCYETHCF